MKKVFLMVAVAAMFCACNSGKKENKACCEQKECQEQVAEPVAEEAAEVVEVVEGEVEAPAEAPAE